MSAWIVCLPLAPTSRDAASSEVHTLVEFLSVPNLGSLTLRPQPQAAGDRERLHRDTGENQDSETQIWQVVGFVGVQPGSFTQRPELRRSHTWFDALLSPS